MVRKAWECFLAVDGKKTFIFELGLEAEKALEQVALAGATNGLDVELKFASRFVERNQNACFDFLTVFQPPAKELGATAPHHAAHLGVGILEREINVT